MYYFKYSYNILHALDMIIFIKYGVVCLIIGFASGAVNTLNATHLHKSQFLPVVDSLKYISENDSCIQVCIQRKPTALNLSLAVS